MEPFEKLEPSVKHFQKYKKNLEDVYIDTIDAEVQCILTKDEAHAAKRCFP